MNFICYNIYRKLREEVHKMTKKQFCTKNRPFASYSLNLYEKGILLNFIDYGINDSVYFTAWSLEKETYHKSKIYYDNDRPYFYFKKLKIYFDECMRIYG